MCQAYFKRCVVTLRTTYEPMVRLFYKIESVAILTHSNYQLEFSTIKKPMRVSWPLPTRNTFTPQYSAQLHNTRLLYTESNNKYLHIYTAQKTKLSLTYPWGSHTACHNSLYSYQITQHYARKQNTKTPCLFSINGKKVHGTSAARIAQLVTFA